MSKGKRIIFIGIKGTGPDEHTIFVSSRMVNVGLVGDDGARWMWWDEVVGARRGSRV